MSPYLQETLCPLEVVQEPPCHSSGADLIIWDVNLFGANGIDFLEPLIQKGCKPAAVCVDFWNFLRGGPVTRPAWNTRYSLSGLISVSLQSGWKSNARYHPSEYCTL